MGQHRNYGRSCTARRCRTARIVIVAADADDVEFEQLDHEAINEARPC